MRFKSIKFLYFSFCLRARKLGIKTPSKLIEGSLKVWDKTFDLPILKRYEKTGHKKTFKVVSSVF